ncbi:hypothetical protein Geu3261_0372_002 [Komagataeibacter europaeus NBRC 3261]|uniref:Uncharacterized protein n=1 Tax=Komagataeibacter europaeus NBRC 3261 TaxID=1234669 RepID=A0A0D6Q365_KOMEU|nr:hypothetical protein Geu3261_0372_002 [Komagataeibacter europaeus NBRC 3261]
MRNKHRSHHPQNNAQIVEVVQEPFLEAELRVVPSERATLDESRYGPMHVKVTFDQSQIDFPDLPQSELRQWLIDLLKKNL